MKRLSGISLFAACATLAASLAAEPFKDGDVVVFFGDSITHGGRYHEFVTDFYRTRYPGRSVRFVNSGVGGDTASGAVRRIPDDVVPYAPTHVAVHFGMNDIGRTEYTADSSLAFLSRRVNAYERWKTNLDRLVRDLRKAVPGAQFVYFTTTVYDDTAVVTNMPAGAKGWATVNQVGCNSGLAMMAGHIANKAKKDKALCVDFYTPLNSFLVRRRGKDPHFMVTRWDRVHPEALGHSIMAWKFLEAQGVSPVVSDVTVDAKTLKAVKSVNASVDAVSGGVDGVKFTVLAKSLPFPVAPEALPYIGEFEVEKKLNREILRVTGLAKGRYVLSIGKRKVGEWTAAELAKGISLGFNPETPQYRQAQEVFAKQAAVSAREREIRNCHYTRWFYQTRAPVDDVKAFSEWFEKNEKNKTMVFARFMPQYVEYWPKHKEIREGLWKDQEAVRALARPRSLEYSLVKAEPLLVFHMDFNIVQMKRDVVMELLRNAAKDGYNAILWEIENKVKLPSLASAVSPEAFSREEFRSILEEADRLGLEPIPLMQTFGHGEYVMNRSEFVHFRERADRADCYCVSKKCVREFQLGLLGDYLDLFGTRLKRFHLGGDEAYWFGTCPVCRKRDRMELFTEHLETMAKRLRSRGIKPGIWHDMLFDKKSAGSKSVLPGDYTIWYWNYGYGTSPERTQKGDAQIAFLSSQKREIVLCGASQSWGDDPFFADMRSHRENLSGLAALVRRGGHAGFCVTSWSVRQALKKLQRPLIEYAAKRFLDPSSDDDADWDAAVKNAFGGFCTAAMVQELFSADKNLLIADARQWSGHKQELPPPEGWLEKRLSGLPGKDKELVARAKAEVARTEAALGKWMKISAPNRAVKLAIRAAKAKIKLYETVSRALSGEKYECPFDEVASLYEEEQTPGSAKISARLVLGYYMRKRP